MQDHPPSAENTSISKYLLVLYLIPIFGCFPSLWTLYRYQRNREHLTVSRLSITLGFTWLLCYMLFTTGAATSEFLTLRLLILNSLWTSGYFLTSIWLIFRVLQGKSSKLPGFSRLAADIFQESGVSSQKSESPDNSDRGRKYPH